MIFGLPAHPLLVHFAVSLLVLVPLAVLVSVFWKGMRNRLDWLLPLGAVAACLVALLAGQAGEALQATLPVQRAAVQTHADLGQWTMRVSIAFGVSVVLWWASVTEHPIRWAELPFLRGKGVRLALTILVAIVSLVALVLVTITGHAGSVAVWG